MNTVITQKNWPSVKLGEVLHKSKAWVEINPLARYKEITVRLWGRGVALRGEIDGAEIAGSRRVQVQAGQFILSRIDARNGAFGLIPEELDGGVVTNDFPVYDADVKRLSLPYLEWLSKTHWFVAAVKEASEGTTNRVRLKEDKFLQKEIPLPPLSEQRRIVARLDELVGKTNQARQLRTEADQEAETLLVSMAHRSDLSEKDKLAAGWQKLNLGECITLVDDQHKVAVDGSYPNLGIYSFGRGLFHKPPIEGTSTSAKTLRRVAKGQFIYSRLFAFEGAYGMVSDDFDGHFVSMEYPTFLCDPKRIRIEFLSSYFKHPSIWRTVAIGSKGLGDRRQRVQPNQILAHELWLPPMPVQNKIATTQAKIAALKPFQSETSTELTAFVPSLLDMAFKGELTERRGEK